MFSSFSAVLRKEIYWGITGGEHLDWYKCVEIEKFQIRSFQSLIVVLSTTVTAGNMYLMSTWNMTRLHWDVLKCKICTRFLRHEKNIKHFIFLFPVTLLEILKLYMWLTFVVVNRAVVIPTRPVSYFFNYLCAKIFIPLIFWAALAVP